MAKGNRVKKDHTAPTQETKRKLMHDIVGHLYKIGTIDHLQYQAAQEIRDVYTEVIACLMPQRNMGSFRVDGGGSHLHKYPLERLPARVECAWRANYLPWTKHANRRVKNRNLTQLQLVVDICIENQSVRRAMEAHGIGRVTCLGILRDGLTAYANQAGWRGKSGAVANG